MNLKQLFFVPLVVGGVTIFSSNSARHTAHTNGTEEVAKKLDSLEVEVNGVKYTIHLKDTVHIGYGSGTDDAFLYIYRQSKYGQEYLGRESSGKSGKVHRIRYFKMNDSYMLEIRGKFGSYAANIPQVFEKKEIIGFNSMRFYKD